MGQVFEQNEELFPSQDNGSNNIFDFLMTTFHWKKRNIQEYPLIRIRPCWSVKLLFDDILLSICQVFNNRLNNYNFCRDFVRVMNPVLGLSSNYWNYRPFLYPSLSIFGFVVCVRLSLNIFQYSTVQIQVLRFAFKIDSAHTIVGVFWVLGILDWGICFIIELFVLFSVPVKTI